MSGIGFYTVDEHCAGRWLRHRQIARVFRRDVKTVDRRVGNALREELSGRRGPSCRIFCDSCPRRCFHDRDGALFTERGTGASRKQRDAPPCRRSSRRRR